MKQKYTEARKEGNRRWDSANLDRMSLALPKGRKGKIKEHVATTGESVNRFLTRAVSETMERDNGGTSSALAKEKEDTALGFMRPETLKAAQEAAKAAGEDLPQFLERAVEIQAKRDALERKLAGESGKPSRA